MRIAAAFRKPLLPLSSAILITLLLIPANDTRSAATGRVISLKNGQLFHKPGDEWLALSTGDAVSFGAAVKTDGKAVAILSLPGKGNFVVGPGTEMTLGEDKPAFSSSLKKGAVWINAKLPHGAGMSIVSPTSVAGVRGTKFSVLADDEGGAVCTCTGELEVTLKSGRSITSTTGTFVPLDAGQDPPKTAVPDFLLLRRKRDDRYKWCFNCHVAGGRGELRRDWAG